MNRSLKDVHSSISAARCGATTDQKKMLSLSTQSYKKISPSKGSVCWIAVRSCGIVLRLMQLVQPEGIIDEQMEQTPAPVPRGQLAVWMLETKIPSVIRGLCVGLTVNAILVGAIEISRDSDRKAVTLLLRSRRFLGVVRTTWKKYDSFRCNVSGFVAAGSIVFFPLYCVQSAKTMLQKTRVLDKLDCHGYPSIHFLFLAFLIWSGVVFWLGDPAVTVGWKNYATSMTFEVSVLFVGNKFILEGRMLIGGAFVGVLWPG